MELYTGTSGYSYKEWKGAFYPEDLPDKEMLRFYGEYFRAVEINNTFHRMPKPSVLEAWAASVPADFKFALKAPQQITHLRRLKDVGEAVSYLIKVAGVLKDRLGPLLFQLPPHLKKDVPRLREFLEGIPLENPVALEFRHESWLDAEVYEVLRRREAAVCVADAENGLQIPLIATAAWGYLRLRRPDYDEESLRTWAERIQAQGWQRAFVFFKHEEEGKGPLLARRFGELARRTGPVPVTSG